MADDENKHGHSTSSKRISKVYVFWFFLAPSVANNVTQFSKSNKYSFISSYRSWLWDDHKERTIQQLSKRVADITGLRTDEESGIGCAEPFQVGIPS